MQPCLIIVRARPLGVEGASQGFFSRCDLETFEIILVDPLKGLRVFLSDCFVLFLLRLSKRDARVEIPASFPFFVRSQIAVKSSLRMRNLLTPTHAPRFD